MHIDFNPDNLDRYFKNQLSEADRQAMEQKIAQDPLLQSEVNFQREVVEAICQKRKWELKQRLEAVAPESSPIFTLPRIAFGTTLTFAGLLTATLFWFDNKKTPSAPPVAERKPIVKHKQENIPTQSKASEEKNAPSKVEQMPVVAPQVVNYTQAVNALPAVIAQPKAVATEEPCAPQTQVEETVANALQDAMIKAYDEILWFEVGNTDTDNGAFDRNSEDERNLDRIASSQLLRYQYYNGQLSLYNNTSAGKQVHTVIDGQARHFLLYEDVYYEFFDGQMTETVMQPIRDKQALKMVKEMLAQLAY
jgi:hypothetical protein